MSARLWKLSADDAPWAFACDWDFSPAMVEAVKHNISPRARAWQPDKKRWVFKASALDTVCHLADLYCGGWINERPEADPAQLPMRAVEAYRELGLVPGAPVELVLAAFRVLAKLRHPDRPGGSTEAMQRLNAAMAVLARAGNR